MAITEIINGRQVPKYVFHRSGYMYTIGPKNGGKLYQPGTRGLVVDDVAKSSGYPRIRFRKSNNVYIINGMDYGYFAAWTDDNSSVRTQSQIYTDPSYLGLKNLILHYPNDTEALNQVWCFPKEVTAFDYQLDDTRWGSKAIRGEYNFYNDGGVRGVGIPNQTVYKWEAHVVISCQYQFAYAFENIPFVIIPYLVNGNWTYTFLTKTHEITGGSDHSYNDRAVLYYSGEFSQNLNGGTGVMFPVIVAKPGQSQNLQNGVFNVQTKFCFKDD